jgi:transcriptional regulator
MYTPRAFCDDNLPRLHSHIAQARLAIVVTHDSNGLLASHIPLLLDQHNGEYGTVSGHLAKANPQCQALANGAQVLVIFPGADAYVSPNFYASKAEHGNVVPTWNYTAVHAHGQAEIFSDAQRLHELVSALTARHEAGQPAPWAVEDAPADYIEGMLKAIVGFSIAITRLEGKRKLSQNRSAADIAGVQTSLAASSDPQDQQLAHLMTFVHPGA